MWDFTQHRKIYRPKNAFLKLMDLSDTFLQFDGPPVHFTLTIITITTAVFCTIIYME
jgi:hypothetical protein